jgi:peptide/nickel transport system ATP-binding protein
VIKAVDGVDLEIFPGEVMGLVGESGCGKSTLSRTILQLVKPTAGQIEFCGVDLPTLAPQAMRQQRRQLQMVFQDPRACLNPMMTVGKSIADPLLIHGLATQLPRPNSRPTTMLARVSLTPTADYFRSFSGRSVRGATAAGGHRSRPDHQAQAGDLRRTCEHARRHGADPGARANACSQAGV